ncbi:hypothetical protein AS25_08005 [Kocuria marina]|uniref:Uncharacterized protein n=1 Tax=Kocuria marina TaxID=223184 RepID=A0A0B0DDS5_9MICC|nr:hypothetical protein AS25_08005 [Kocuria marina]
MRDRQSRSADDAAASPPGAAPVAAPARGDSAGGTTGSVPVSDSAGLAEERSTVWWIWASRAPGWVPMNASI